MAHNPLEKRHIFNRMTSKKSRKGPSPIKKAVGNIFLVLSILLIATGAFIGFAQGVKKETPADTATTVTTATVTTTSATKETTTAVTTETTVSTQAL